MAPDAVVVGLGAVGSAALYQLALRGARVIGIDRFTPPHDHGSSHGESRITRQAIGEGEEYVPFAQRSHEIWRELESETGRLLLSATGGLILSGESGPGLHGKADFVGRTIAAAKRFRIAHEVLTADEVMKRFPRFRLVGSEICYYEPGAGFLRPELCVATQLDRARALGAVVRTGETVTRVTADAASATVVTDEATYTAGSVIVSAGAWVSQLLHELFGDIVRVYAQELFWFAPDDAAAFAPGRFPVFIWRHGAGEDDHFYGCPVVGEGVKLATEQFAEIIEPDRARSTPSAAEAQRMYEAHVRGRLAGVGDRCMHATTCLYTVCADSGFVIDRHPEWERILVASPCSGHGFKHSAAIGEALAQWVMDGRSRLDLTPFSLARFAIKG